MHCDIELVRFFVDLMQKELEARKSEVKEYEAKISELHKQAQEVMLVRKLIFVLQVYRLQEYEAFYVREQEEKKKVESAYVFITHDQHSNSEQYESENCRSTGCRSERSFRGITVSGKKLRPETYTS